MPGGYWKHRELHPEESASARVPMVGWQVENIVKVTVVGNDVTKVSWEKRNGKVLSLGLIWI